MTDHDFHNRQLTSLTIKETPEGRYLSFETSFLKTFITSFTRFHFCLLVRGTEDFIQFDAEKKPCEDETMDILTGELHLEPHLKNLKPGVYWDLCLIGESNGEWKYTRIKAGMEDIRLNSFPNHNDIFIPYRTKKGNVSFKLSPSTPISMVEDLKLTDGGVIKLTGYAVYLPETKGDVKVVSKNLVITNHLTEDEITVPLENEIRQDLTERYARGNEDYSTSGFYGEVTLHSFNNQSSNNYYKFFVEIAIETSEGIQHIRSKRLKFQPRNATSKNQETTVRLKGASWKLRVKPTKKSDFLSVRMYQYKPLRQIAGKAKRFLLRVKQGKTVKRAYKTAFVLLGKLPAKKKQVVFESFLGKQYSCNPRAIYEYMVEHHPEYDMYWSIDPRSAGVFKGKGLKTINRFSIQWLFKMARSKYWVSNSRLPIWIPKPNHTTYLQTWHGTPLKRLAADMDEVHMPGTNTAKYKRNFLKESSRWDYLISPNRYSSEIFARAFGFEKDMIESGYPRNDFLHNANNAETMYALKKRLDLPLDKKVIIYAPTWRDNEFYAKGKYKFNLKLELDKMQEELGDEYIVLLRMHYLIAENLDITPFAGFAYDVSHHTDISELYLISDLLITDYSSVFFDYANLGRPMIFYVYDIENYRDTLRGFYFDFEAQAPGPLVKTTEDVIRHIQHPDPASQANFDAFYQKFCYLEDGEASKRVVEKVFKTK
ncbi:CDP-glycerol glycerophosphotransferase family protein [Rossellomorea marisflavi]|uniref:CDP-glycerol glycerophosphotransferase family protein n=1 Tax=Rossellomorea marisflavi TaxID=189381 RepID=UPI0025AFA0BA|nr:CDP-glycerol glycerophosphotransferase family protein [Rossellomorea marisflavi]WJV19303.1 CDP-glycerol glycerophosphotransferase family protein [Rossellomorea marisflavi]